MVSEEVVVEKTTAAAEDVIFSRCDPSTLEDIDITIRYTEGRLDIDIYLDGDSDELQQIAEDAALAARRVADELIEDA